MQKIVRVSGLTSGPVVAEFIIKNGRQPVLVEVAPEVGGEYIAEYIAPASLGKDYFEELIRLELNPEYKPASARPESKEAVIIRYIPQSSGVIKKFRFPFGLERREGYLFSRALKESGETCLTARGNLDRPGVFAFQASLTEESEKSEESGAGQLSRQTPEPDETRADSNKRK